MSEDHVAQEKHYGYTVTVRHDEFPSSPLEDDNLGIIATSHRRYDLGDETLPTERFSSWEEIKEYLRKEKGATHILPLYLYDHSGISISTSSFIGRAHHARWDSGQVGFIYTTKEIIEKLGVPKNQVLKQLKGEVETYDQYLRGDIYSYEVTDHQGEIVDSVHGYYSEEDALAEGRASIPEDAGRSIHFSYAVVSE